MIGQKTQMAIAIIAAVLLAILLAEISYFLIPAPSNQTPLPTPVPSIPNQIFMAILWIGFAALITVTTVAAVLLINRIITKRKHLE